MGIGYQSGTSMVVYSESDRVVESIMSGMVFRGGLVRLQIWGLQPLLSCLA